MEGRISTELFELVQDLSNPILFVYRHKSTGLPLIIELNLDQTSAKIRRRDQLNESNVETVCTIDELKDQIIQATPLLTKPEANSKESVWFELMHARVMEFYGPRILAAGIAVAGTLKRQRVEGEEDTN